MKRTIGVLVATAALFALTACGDSGGKGGASGSYCDLVRSYTSSNSALDDAFTSGDAGALKTELNKLKPMLQTLQSQAPDEIKADVDLMATNLLKMIDVFDKYDYDMTKVAAAPEFADVSTAMTSDEVSKASDNLDKYESEVCGITPTT
jgi:hypothetical protein